MVPDAIVPTPGTTNDVVVELRCNNCGWMHVGSFPVSAVEELDRALDRTEREIRTALEICELSESLDQIDRFSRALQTDLITPEDF